MFVEKYIGALTSSDLRDDEFHATTEALMASALADLKGSGKLLGSLLARVKYADGTVHKLFESGTGNLAALLRIWTVAVTEKGMARGWMKPTTEWDAQAAYVLYASVANLSLAHWLDGHCQPCKGTKVTSMRQKCPSCDGTGRAKIQASRVEIKLAADMVSELEGLYQAHGARAGSLMRREV